MLDNYGKDWNTEHISRTDIWVMRAWGEGGYNLKVIQVTKSWDVDQQDDTKSNLKRLTRSLSL